MSYNPKNLIPIISNPENFQTTYSQKISTEIFCPEVSPFTKQEFKDECDINILMSKYLSTGEMPNINESAPQYLDVTGLDYQEQMNFVAGAQSLFNQLPAPLRNRFDNDPAKFLDFTADEGNRDEMAALGLLKPVDEWVKPPTPEPAAVPPTPAPPAPSI